MAALPPDENRAPLFLSLNYILTSAALVLILIRCYVRLRLVGGWGWDDSIIIITWLCLLSVLVITQLMANLGLGRHIQYIVPPENRYQILKLMTSGNVIVIFTTLLTKISISIFILRIKNTQRVRRLLFVMMGIMSVASIVPIALLLAQCRPLRKIWTPDLPGKCFSVRTTFATVYVLSGFTFTTDLCLSISPMVILWNVNITLKRKVLVSLLMSLGLSATICNGLRNKYTPRLLSPDFTYDVVGATVCVTLETTLGVIAACVPACVPFFKQIRYRNPHELQNPASSSKGEFPAVVKMTEISLNRYPEKHATSCHYILDQSSDTINSPVEPKADRPLLAVHLTDRTQLQRN